MLWNVFFFWESVCVSTGSGAVAEKIMHIEQSEWIVRICVNDGIRDKGEEGISIYLNSVCNDRSLSHIFNT